MKGTLRQTWWLFQIFIDHMGIQPWNDTHTQDKYKEELLGRRVSTLKTGWVLLNCPPKVYQLVFLLGGVLLDAVLIGVFSNYLFL